MNLSEEEEEDDDGGEEGSVLTIESDGSTRGRRSQRDVSQVSSQAFSGPHLSPTRNLPQGPSPPRMLSQSPQRSRSHGSRGSGQSRQGSTPDRAPVPETADPEAELNLVVAEAGGPPERDKHIRQPHADEEHQLLSGVQRTVPQSRQTPSTRNDPNNPPTTLQLCEECLNPCISEQGRKGHWTSKHPSISEDFKSSDARTDQRCTTLSGISDNT